MHTFSLLIYLVILSCRGPSFEEWGKPSASSPSNLEPLAAAGLGWVQLGAWATLLQFSHRPKTQVLLWRLASLRPCTMSLLKPGFFWHFEIEILKFGQKELAKGIPNLWIFSLYSPVMRKLVNESLSAFLSLQKLAKEHQQGGSGTSLTAGQLTNVSKQYRSVIR